jgi:hypothetical protein
MKISYITNDNDKFIIQIPPFGTLTVKLLFVRKTLFKNYNLLLYNKIDNICTHFHEYIFNN